MIFLLNVEVFDKKNNLYKIKSDILPLLFLKLEQLAKNKNNLIPNFDNKDCVFFHNDAGEDFYLDIFYRTKLEDEDIINSITNQILANIKTVLSILGLDLDLIQSSIDKICEKFDI